MTEVLINSIDPSLSDPQDSEEDEVEDFSKLEVNETEFDLSTKEGAEDALNTIREYRAQLKNNNLEEYEDKSTDYGQGGRSRIMYDELRADLAVRYWDGEHQLDWEEQHEAANNIKAIKAAQMKAQGKW
jgi:hypothetical protein